MASDETNNSDLTHAEILWKSAAGEIVIPIRRVSPRCRFDMQFPEPQTA
jgi:hypothetical protein